MGQSSEARQNKMGFEWWVGVPILVVAFSSLLIGHAGWPAAGAESTYEISRRIGSVFGSALAILLVSSLFGAIAFYLAGRSRRVFNIAALCVVALMGTGQLLLLKRGLSADAVREQAAIILDVQREAAKLTADAEAVSRVMSGADIRRTAKRQYEAVNILSGELRGAHQAAARLAAAQLQQFAELTAGVHDALNSHGERIVILPTAQDDKPAILARMKWLEKVTSLTRQRLAYAKQMQSEFVPELVKRGYPDAAQQLAVKSLNAKTAGATLPIAETDDEIITIAHDVQRQLYEEFGTWELDQAGAPQFATQASADKFNQAMENLDAAAKRQAVAIESANRDSQALLESVTKPAR